MKRSLLIACFLFIYSSLFAQLQLQPINFSEVTITDKFWKPKIEKVATKTLAACIYQTETATARIRNFEKVARNKGEKHEGIYYDDSDVYKALEAMSYALKSNRDPVLENKADEWIAKIASAQQPDGYLNTYYTLNGLDKRWSDIEKHEDYNAGHLIEAGIAYFNATGKTQLLDVAIRFADHIDSNFRMQNKKWFSGHQEIELALVKLYHVTKNERYLKLAQWYLDQRGQGYYTYGGNWIKPEYWQDHLPVKDQKQITGHAVRAMYLYTGMADVAATTNDPSWLSSMKAVWEDVVYRNYYLTGGIGSSGDNEGFSKDYDLPNEKAYCETCASVGMVFWNQRMNALTGESKYIDVLERSLYNGALDGISLGGDLFFYDNPLASDGRHQRKGWFGTACCPSNIARLVSSVGNYIYAQTKNELWVNLFIASETNFQFGDSRIPVKMETDYPWDGKVQLNLSPEKPSKFKLHIRLPGWSRDEIVPGGLYKTFDKKKAIEFNITLNGKHVSWKLKDGYAVIDRQWKYGDKITIAIPMGVKRIFARQEVSENKDRIAVQRGPLVYCVEGADNGDVWNLLVPTNPIFKTVNYKVLNEDVLAIETDLLSAAPGNDGTSIVMNKKKVIAIPYYTWANRGANSMQVWLPVKISSVKINAQ